MCLVFFIAISFQSAGVQGVSLFVGCFLSASVVLLVFHPLLRYIDDHEIRREASDKFFFSRIVAEHTKLRVRSVSAHAPDRGEKRKRESAVG